MRWSWYLLPCLIYEVSPDVVDGVWDGITFFCTFFWCGEVGYRYWTSWIIGELMEDRDGVRSKADVKIENLRTDLKEAKQTVARHRREQSKMDDLQYRLNATRGNLRKARKYVDEMTDYFGPMPSKTKRK